MTHQLGDEQDALSKILGIIESLSHIKDLDALLDKVLLEARRLTNADAGSIYLVKDNMLNFSYCHNDTLFTSPSNKYIYTKSSLEINNRSIAGYVALTGESLVIDDAYNISSGLPFTFNTFFDSISGYKTSSILTVPMKTSTNKIVGVLQIINALDSNREAIPFTEKDKIVLTYFANNAAVAIERAAMTREVILRMVRMCELRDPQETGPHVNRVGAFSAEIYQQWALNRGVPLEEIKRNRDKLRIAAMLHDLGKVAISDIILKKGGKLSPDEFSIMKYHTIYGARFFENSTSELDALSMEIALNHHEKWDGTGYPGGIDDIFTPDVRLGEGKKGEEIPSFARIVALADVYDALVSKRVYKGPESEEEATNYIRNQAGRHFDPQVVVAFFAVYEVILAIREKFLEEASEEYCQITP